MKDVSVRNKKSKFDLKSGILLGALALVVIVGLKAAAQPASDSMGAKTNKLLFGGMKLLDPFALITTSVPLSRSNTVVFSSPKTTIPQGLPGKVILGDTKLGSPILIPIRQGFRSPYRRPS